MNETVSIVVFRLALAALAVAGSAAIWFAFDAAGHKLRARHFLQWYVEAAKENEKLKAEAAIPFAEPVEG